MEDIRHHAKRLASALRQVGRGANLAPDRIERAVEATITVAEICGNASRSRQALYRIGKTLLLQSGSVIITPICPDYTHENGKYTFRGLGGGVPLLARHHFQFMRNVVEHVPGARPIFLIADLESKDIELCKAVGKSRDEFNELVLSSLASVRTEAKEYGWQAELMSRFIPELPEQERLEQKRISGANEYQNRIRSDTWSRKEMYWRINSALTERECMERTTRTAAQYCALGAYAANARALICNHTTVNLSWYLETEVGLLHNPISVY